MRSLTSFAVWAGLYLFLSGADSASEVYTAIAVGVLVAIAERFVLRFVTGRFAITALRARLICRAVTALIRAVLYVTAVFVRTACGANSPGRSYLCEFDFGRASDPQERLRRAVAVLLACLAPDHFVVSLAEEKGNVLIHTILADESALDRRWLQ